MSPERVVVVGGGVLGTFHAWEAVRRGFEVVHVEREAGARGATVRNFGLIWVSGRAPGAELALALRAREAWEAVAEHVPGAGFRPAGSLTVATGEDGPGAQAALELAASLPDAADRGFALLEGADARRRCPALGPSVAAALWCERDAVVEPRLVPEALQARLARSDRYRWVPGRHVVAASAGGVRDHTGTWHGADRVVLCPGADHTGVAAELLAPLPLRRVRLQMLQTSPAGFDLGPALADIDSLRYYPAFAGAPRDRLPPQAPVAATWAAQLLLVQRGGGGGVGSGGSGGSGGGGGLTIGDTHRHDEPLDFDYDTGPEDHLLARAAALLGRPLPPVARRWTGVYSQCTDGRLYARAQPEPGLTVVTGPGGRGMTLAPAIAQETFT